MTDKRECELTENGLVNMITQCVTYCAYGVWEKSRFNAENGIYVYSKSLKTGLAKLQNIFLRYGDKDALAEVARMTDTRFLTDYACLPVPEWFKHCSREVASALDKVDAYHSPITLLNLYPTGEFDPTMECARLVASDERITNASIQQHDAILSMFAGTQKQYVLSRLFYIQHPVLTVRDFIKYTGSNMPGDLLPGITISDDNKDFLANVINLRYERVRNVSNLRKCNWCGWTAQERGPSIVCACPACEAANGNRFDLLEPFGKEYRDGCYRLQQGLMQYMAIPGQLEKAISNILVEAGVGFEWWPQMDTADFLVKLHDGSIMAIDAKNYRNAANLAHPSSDQPIHRLEADLYVYVVPDEIIGNIPAPNPNVTNQVVTLSGFRALLSHLERKGRS